MGSSALDEIDGLDLEKIGLKILENSHNGKYIENDETRYIQITDSTGIMDDGTFRCHFELLRIYRTNIKHGHTKDRIYVEVHFEEPKCNIFFNSIVSKLLKENDDLTSFPWYDGCPLIRLKKNGFQFNQKEEIISNLVKLKKIVLRTILENYELSTIDGSSDSNYGFEYSKSSSKNISTKRGIKESIRKATVIDILHEEIKDQLIRKIENNSSLLGIEYNIDIDSLVSEHPVNGNSYIDLVAKTLNGKIIFFEIKTSVSARLCIRQALGQLLEYSYFPNMEGHADKLVIVGTGERDENIKLYLENLNSKFNLNIEYLSIK